MSTITAEDLQTIGLPRDAHAFFRAAFPAGAPSWRAVATHPDCPRYCRGWIAVRAPGLTLAERWELADQSDYPAHVRGWIAVHAPGLTLAERLELADRSDDPAWRRGWIAVRAAGLTLAERLELADRSGAPAYYRQQVAARWGTAAQPQSDV